MHLAFHFVVSMAVGAMLARGGRRRVPLVLLSGALGILPDLDHILAPVGWPAAWMHSGYILVFAPFMLLVSAFVFDNATLEREWKAVPAALGILAVLSGHLALDIAAGNALPLAFPAEGGLFHAEQGLLFDAAGRTLLAAGDVAIACWAFFAAFAFFATGGSNGYDGERQNIFARPSSYRWFSPSGAASR